MIVQHCSEGLRGSYSLFPCTAGLTVIHSTMLGRLGIEHLSDVQQMPYELACNAGAAMQDGWRERRVAAIQGLVDTVAVAVLPHPLLRPPIALVVSGSAGDAGACAAGAGWTC